MKQCCAIGFAILVMVIGLYADDAESKRRKAVQSQFEIDDLNKFMLAAVDNSSNNVKFATPPGEYRVWGRVFDDVGDPVEGAPVMLGGQSHGPYLYLANFDVTDRHGRFVLQGAPDKQTVFVSTDEGIFALPTLGETDVTVKAPPLQEVSIEVDPAFELYDHSIRLQSRSSGTNGLRIVGDLSTTLAKTQSGRFRLPAGHYSVTGYRKLTFDTKTERGWIEFGEIEVHEQGRQTFQLEPRNGTRVSGVIADFASRTTNALGLRVSIYSTGSGNDYRSRTLDTVACRADGTFEFQRIPPGSYTVAVTTIQRPRKTSQPAFSSFGAMTSPPRFESRVKVTGAETHLVLPQPPETVADSTVARAHQILDSQHPTPNVSWSWSDVQISELRGIKDREGTIDELHRILQDNSSPRNWQWLVLEALWRIHPISQETKEVLIEALHDPGNFERRSSILRTLTEMKSGALEYLDLIIHMRDDEDWRVRYGVARAMSEVGGTQAVLSDVVVDTAVELLKDPHGEVRKQAAGTLGVLQSSRAVKALEQRLNDPFPPARAMAAWALWECSGEVEPALSTMMDLLQNGDFEGRKEAASYLNMFDHRAAAALPLLRANATDEKKPPFRGTRETVRYQLRRISESAIEAIEAAIALQAETDSFDPRPVSGSIADAGLNLPNDAWGLERQGLQFAIGLDSEATDFSAGERVPLRMFARNNTDHPIRFQLDRRLPGASPSLKRDKQRVYVRSVRLLVAPAPIEVVLPPGGIIAIPHTGLCLGENAQPGKFRHPFAKDVSSGSYQLSQRLWIRVFDEEQKVKNAIWYETGTAKFTVL